MAGQVLAGQVLTGTAALMMTLHLSGQTEEMRNVRAHLIAENIERAARGEMPLDAIHLTC